MTDRGGNQGRTEIQKCEYLENKESFLDETKSIFHSFEGLPFGEKNKKHRTLAWRNNLTPTCQ